MLLLALILLELYHILIEGYILRDEEAKCFFKRVSIT